MECLGQNDCNGFCWVGSKKGLQVELDIYWDLGPFTQILVYCKVPLCALPIMKWVIYGRNVPQIEIGPWTRKKG